MANSKDTDYREILTDDESLMIFLEKVQQFNQRFSEMMFKGEDFHLSLEVSGSKGELSSCRLHGWEKKIRQKP